MRLTYAIIFVSDMKRSITFYRDVVGLPLKFESSHWTEFATDGATIALHAASDLGVPSATADAPAGRCRPGLNVGNLDLFHKKMIDNKAPCVQEPKKTFGERIALYRDPDGLILSVSEERR